MVNTIGPDSRPPIPEREETEKRSHYRAEAGRFKAGVYEEHPKRNMMGNPGGYGSVGGAKVVRSQFLNGAGHRFGNEAENIDYDVPNFGRGRTEFSQRIDLSNINNIGERNNFAERGERVKRAGVKPGNQPSEEHENPFFFNNKNNANNLNNVTGSYVRGPAGNKNDEYLRKTYNYYGEYRDKSLVTDFVN